MALDPLDGSWRAAADHGCRCFLATYDHSRGRFDQGRREGLRLLFHARQRADRVAARLMANQIESIPKPELAPDRPLFEGILRPASNTPEPEFPSRRQRALVTRLVRLGAWASKKDMFDVLMAWGTLRTFDTAFPFRKVPFRNGKKQLLVGDAEHRAARDHIAVGWRLRGRSRHRGPEPAENFLIYQCAWACSSWWACN